MSRTLRAPRSQVLVAAVAFILGLLVVVQLRSQAGGDRLAAMSSQDLTFLVTNLNQSNDDLRNQVATLERQLETLELSGTRGTSSVNEIRGDLARIRAWAGLDAVSGDGITITVRGPIPGAALEDLVNELRNAGAEAIAIGDVRVVAATVIGGTEGAVSVDDTALGDEFTVQAIGTPESMTGSLTRTGGIVAQFAATYPGATLEVEPVERMILPATIRNLLPSHGRPRL
jgi:uncharacterized protein YlxW (UPF0749 family)